VLRRSGKPGVARGLGASLQRNEDGGLHGRWRVSGVAHSSYLEFDFPVAVRVALEALEHKPKSIDLFALAPSPRATGRYGHSVRSACAEEFVVGKIEAYRDEGTSTDKPKQPLPSRRPHSSFPFYRRGAGS
jgi:hypothetical protein